jgi:hypothetical protein
MMLPIAAPPTVLFAVLSPLDFPDTSYSPVLLDENDAAFQGEKEHAEALRGILNTGFYAGGVASACVGQGANITFKDFRTFLPKATAGIGKLPDTVADRSIAIRLERKKSGRVVSRFRAPPR